MNFIFLFLCFAAFASPTWGSPCDECTAPVIQPSKVQEYCHKQTLNMSNRCCVNSTASNFTDSDIVGIDLRNCSLHNVTGVFKNMTSVVVIALEVNPMTDVTEEDFYHLTELNNISLPGKLKSCPGGAVAWEERYWTSDRKTLVCEAQVNMCNTMYNNDTCPSPQSNCSPAGPGLVDCLCSPDYHGYKCLRKGTFPMVPFVSGICGSTVVASIFLWVTQRRFVKKHT